MKRLIFVILMLHLIFSNAFARTRNEVFIEAGLYKNCSWVTSSVNILDVKKWFDEDGNELQEPINGVSDGIDDRAQNRLFPNGNSSLWPFKKGETYTGEAYAWAGYSGAIKWGADTVSVFKDRILDTDNKWIAGRTGGDSLPTGYKGFAGIDCSGLVGNALNINRFAADRYKLNVSQIKARCFSVKLEEMKKGDVFASNGHILLFTGNWVTQYSKAKVIHSVPYRYSDKKHVQKVFEETVEVKKEGNIIKLKNEKEGDWIPHDTLSPFPQFSDFDPEEGQIIGDSKPEIKLKIKSGTNIKASSIVMKIDGIVVSPDISSSSDAKEINVSYTPTDDLSLEEHNVYKTLALT